MAENTGEVKMTPTLGLTGLTMNAMALIAPGAFLWLTFFIQATTGAPAPAMWIGIVVALLLCLATAVCYAEMAKLYPGTGSSYYFAEQSFLNHEKAWKYARLSKFIVGWGSHLYYWIYPGVMVGVTGIFVGYVAGTLWPNSMSASNPGPVFMGLVAVVFSLGVAYIAHRGVNGSTGVNIAINVIQISALIVFSVMALGYRMNHPPGSVAFQFDSTSGEAYTYEFATTSQMVNGTATDVVVRDANMVPQPKLDASGKPVPYHVDYPYYDPTGAFLIQGAFCYLFEYFASCYFLNSGYTLASAAGSAAPIGDMMIMTGDALFGQGHGRAFMLVEAVTVFLALIGTTLSCLNTGARVTYAMGKDQEVPEHFGMLHEKNLSPHRAIWALAIISAVIGCIGVTMAFGDAGAPSDAAIQALPHSIWSSVGYTTHDKMAALPNSLLTVTLASNFGTFLLYGLSCIICLVAYHNYPNFKVVRHVLIPIFGIVANLICMGAYIVPPFMGYGTKMEPFLALGIAAVWAIYGGIYFLRASKATGRTTLVTSRT